MKTRHLSVLGCFYFSLILFVSSCGSSDGPLIPYQYPNGKYGYVDENGKEVIDGKFDSAKEFKEDLAAVSMGQLFGYINRKGKIVIPLQYTSASSFVDGIALVSKGYKYGCIHFDNQEIIPCEYDYLMKTAQDSFLCKGSKNGLEGYIRLDGKVLIPFEYDKIESFYDGEAFAVRNGKIGVLRENGEVVVPCMYDEIKPWIENLYVTKSNHLYGLLDPRKREMLACEYERIYTLGTSGASGGKIIYLQKGNQYGLMNSNGEVLTPCKYDKIGSYGKGNLVVVFLNGKIGYVDKSGAEKIAPVYDFSRDAGECYVLSREGKHGLADKETGRILKDCIYDEIELITANLFRVTLNEKVGLVNMKGENVLEPKYEKIVQKFIDEDFLELVLATPEGRRFTGLARYSDGQLVVPANRYLSIGHFDKGEGQYAEVIMEISKYTYRKGVINRAGKEVVPCEYAYTFIVEDGYCIVKPYTNDGKNIRVKLKE